MSRRHNRIVGAVSTVAAFLVVGVAPLSHADGVEDAVVDAVAAAAGAHDSLGDVAASAAAVGSVADPTAVHEALSNSAAAVVGTTGDPGALTSATIPLTVNPSIGGTNIGGEPVISISVGGASPTNVLVDTGSNGLVIPWWNTAWWNNLFTLPKGLGFGQFAGGVGYFYEVMPYTVEFGANSAGAVTSGPADVDVVLFTFPTTLQSLFSLNWSLSGMLGPANADGILGIGANAVGPSHTNPIEALPGVLSQGVLIDQANHTMTFGADPFAVNQGVVIQGSPNAPLYVSFDGGHTGFSNVNSILDSGGVFGTMPANMTGGNVGQVLADGQQVSVYSAAPGHGGTLLYNYTVSAANHDSPTIVPTGNQMNTGNWLFQQNQVYVSVQGANGFMHIVPNSTVTP